MNEGCYLGVSKIVCHCGREHKIVTEYPGMNGWYECSCGCAWIFEALLIGNILRKERDCQNFKKEEVKIFKHYPYHFILNRGKNYE
jgi:hypothetical protein